MEKHRSKRWSRGVFVGLSLVTGASACSGVMDPEILTLFVAPQLVECQGVAPETCMQVRESPEEEWRNFFGSILGFEFEPGFFYELRVERHRVDNPPADGSSFRYVLRRLVSKIPEI